MFIRSVLDAIGDRPLAAVPPGTTIRDAAHLLDRYNIGALAVMAEGGLQGILSERDVIRRCIAQDADPATTLVDAVMTRDPETVEAGAGLADAIARMEAGQFRHLPVMKDGTCIGILSIRDIPTEYRMMYERFREMRG